MPRGDLSRHNEDVAAFLVVKDLEGFEWRVSRQWFARRPRRRSPDRSASLSGWRDEWDWVDLLLLPLAVLGLPELAMQAAIVAAGVLALLIVLPTWLVVVATGWSWPIAGAGWLAASAILIVAHPLLRVPLRLPWLVVALRTDQDWASRSAWQVRGWRRSLEAVSAVGASLEEGHGPVLASSYLL